MAQLIPPFTQETAQQKVKKAQKLWNSCNPDVVAKAYTEDSIWRNRDVFLSGRDEIRTFLQGKWAKEKRYRLRKELFLFGDNKIAVQFWYEYHHNDQWYRCYGLEHWTFAADGLMQKRQMSGNDVPIAEDARWFKDEMTDEELDAVNITATHW